MATAKSEEEWAERARVFLKAELQKAEVTYQELAKRLKKHGFIEETEASITNKLKRGTFPATFFLASLRAIGSRVGTHRRCIIRRMERLGVAFAFAALIAMGALGLGHEIWPNNAKPQDYSYPAKTERQDSPSYPSLVVAHKQEEAAPTSQKSEWDRILWDHITDWILALFTGLLVLYTRRLYVETGGLRDSTNKLWKAGESQLAIAREAAEAAKQSADAASKSATAAVRIELPILVALTPALMELSEPMPEDGPYAATDIDSYPKQYSAIADIRLRNHGRTPAIPKRLTLGWHAGNQLPAIPVYQHINLFRRGEAILPGTEAPTIIATPTHTIELSSEQSEEIRDEKMTLWVYVVIDYLDFMGDPHQAGFCWEWARPFGMGTHLLAAVGDPPEAYIKQT